MRIASSESSTTKDQRSIELYRQIDMTNFDEYIRQSEPQKREKGYAWQTAIGLQAVDGLKPSEYLINTARRHIEGDITIDEVQELIKSYYELKDIQTERIMEQKKRIRFLPT